MNKYKDFFDCPNGCGGKLSLKDNGKTPTGLLVCGKCKSLFRIVVVSNNYVDAQINQKPIPYKEIKNANKKNRKK